MKYTKSIGKLILLVFLSLMSACGCCLRPPVKFCPVPAQINGIKDGLVITMTERLQKGKAFDCGSEVLLNLIKFCNPDCRMSLDELNELAVSDTDNGMATVELPIILRKSGLLPDLKIGSTEIIRDCLKSGNPVIVLIDMSEYIKSTHGTEISATALNHYFIICGYDTNKNVLIANWYDGYISLEIEPFKKAWANAGRFALTAESR